MLNKLLDKLSLLKKKDCLQDYYSDSPKDIRYDSGSLVDAILLSATLYPDNIAIEYFNTKITYIEFVGRIKNCAKALKAQGIKENDVVTICMPNTPEAVIMFYAINMVGAIANMIHPLSSENEIEFYLNKSKSKMILTIDLCYLKVLSIIKNTNVEKIVVASASKSMGLVLKILYYLTKKRVRLEKKDFILTWKNFIKYGSIYQKNYYTKRNGTDVALILYSGGTTGKPKGIKLSNLNLNAGAIQSRYMSEVIKPCNSFLTILPNFHAFGIGISTHTPLYNGMKIILIPQFDMKKFGKVIKKYKPNVVAGVPSLFDALTKIKFKKNDLECIRLAVCGGDYISVESKRKINSFLKQHGSPTELRVGYGLTECSGATVLCPEGIKEENNAIGIPFPNCLYKIVKIGTINDAKNEDGEICISGPNVMLGYLDEIKETELVLKKHHDGKVWLHTGDIGCIKDGFLYYKSRLKRMIVTNGYNIYPSYIEELLMQKSYIESAVIIGKPHLYKGEIAKAFIVLKEGVNLNKEIKKDINRHLKKNLANYAIPEEIQYVDFLPKTLVGKISYKDLK